MAVPLPTCTALEQRSVMCVLSNEGAKPIEIHRSMAAQRSDSCLSLQQVYEWSRKFRNGVTSVADAPRVLTRQSTAAAEAIVMDNRRVTLDEISANLNISHVSAHHLIHDMLQFRKVPCHSRTERATR